MQANPVAAELIGARQILHRRQISWIAGQPGTQPVDFAIQSEL